MLFLDDFPADELRSFTSSPQQITLELPPVLADMGGLKRKRAFEMDESSLMGLSSPCSASIALSTPPLSFSESMHDIPDMLRPQPHPLQRNISSDSRHSKRIHLISRSRMPRHISVPSSDLSSRSSISSPTSAVMACHVCSRRPSTLQDLPAYNDCQTCHQRTCFVCMRTCEGPRCQRIAAHITMGIPIDIDHSGKRICSKCCVEVGSEGTVWCNPCYQDDSELEQFRVENKEELQAESEGRVAEWLNRFSGPDEMDMVMDGQLLQEHYIGL